MDARRAQGASIAWAVAPSEQTAGLLVLAALGMGRPLPDPETRVRDRPTARRSAGRFV